MLPKELPLFREMALMYLSTGVGVTPADGKLHSHKVINIKNEIKHRLLFTNVDFRRIIVANARTPRDECNELSCNSPATSVSCDA